jgi:hypothetical protein
MIEQIMPRFECLPHEQKLVLHILFGSSVVVDTIGRNSLNPHTYEEYEEVFHRFVGEGYDRLRCRVK